MATGLVETPLGPASPFLSGEIEADCYELGGVSPVMIIRSDQEWEVRVKWKMDGLLVPWINPNLKWHLHVTLESMGPGPESSIFAAHRSWGATPEWEEKETFGEDFIENLYAAEGMTPPHESALFKVFAILTLRTPGGTPLPCAGNVDMGNIQWYKVPE